jgi:hypothetical protein
MTGMQNLRILDPLAGSRRTAAENPSVLNPAER